MKVTVTQSAWYTVVGGGWTGMRPQGRRRDYKTNVGGKNFQSTSKAELQSAVRRHVRRLEDEARFVHVPVQFEFVDAPSEPTEAQVVAAFRQARKGGS